MVEDKRNLHMEDELTGDDLSGILDDFSLEEILAEVHAETRRESTGAQVSAGVPEMPDLDIGDLSAFKEPPPPGKADGSARSDPSKAETGKGAASEEAFHIEYADIPEYSAVDQSSQEFVRKYKNKKTTFKPGGLFEETAETVLADHTTVSLEDTGEFHTRAEKEWRQKEEIPYDFADRSYENTETGIVSATRAERSFLLRGLLSLPFFLLGAWLSFAPPYSLPMPPGFSYLAQPYFYLLAMALAQLFCMLLALDIMASGIWRLVRLRPTMDSLLFLSAFASFLHTASIFVWPEFGGYLPFCCVSCGLLAFSLFARSGQMSALRRTLKILSISESPLGIMLESKKKGGKRAIQARIEVTPELLAPLKKMTGTEGFSLYYAPLFIVISFVLAFAASFGAGESTRFFWAFSAISAVCLPFPMLFSSATPMKRAARRLFSAGAALLGTESLKGLRDCTEVVITDEDIFPSGSIGINGLRVVGAYSFEKVLAYTASVMAAADMGLRRVFSDLLQQQFIQQVQVERLRFYESGGVSAEINGDLVLIGTAGFLLRMGIRVREGLDIKNSVFTAINSELVGIFALKYRLNTNVFDAFHLFARHKITPVLAVRDFNLTPGMLESRLKMKTGSTEYPDISERLDLSEKERFFVDLPCAVLVRNSTVTLSECLAVGKGLRSVIRANLAISLVSAVLGILVVFYLTYNGAFAAAAPHNLFIYQMLWMLLSVVNTWRAGRF